MRFCHGFLMPDGGGTVGSELGFGCRYGLSFGFGGYGPKRPVPLSSDSVRLPLVRSIDSLESGGSGPGIHLDGQTFPDR